MSNMNPARPRTAVIFGGSSYGEHEEVFQQAEALGAALARAGWAVANGGYGGVMLAASRGAHAAGGHVVGVVCDIFKSPPNEFITERIGSGDLHERLRRLIEVGDAYIVMPGSTGTLAELAMVWELVNKKLLPMRPILVWGEFWRPVITVFEDHQTGDPRINTLGLPEVRGDLVRVVHNVEEALAALGEAAPAG